MQQVGSGSAAASVGGRRTFGRSKREANALDLTLVPNLSPRAVCLNNADMHRVHPASCAQLLEQRSLTFNVWPRNRRVPMVLVEFDPTDDSQDSVVLFYRGRKVL
jgi:hypothetical protein